MSFITKLMGFFVLLLPIASFSGQFDDLNVQCKREKAPTNRMILNANQMFAATLKIIKEKEAERKAQGKELEVIIVARAGTNPKKNILLRDNPYGEELTLENMRKQAVQKFNATRRDTSGTRGVQHDTNLEEIVEELFAEPKNSERNIAYSHVGLLVRSDLDPIGWSFVHLLSPCNSSKSRIYHEGIATFFMDDPYAYKAWFMIPTDEIQKRMIDVINSTTRPDGNTIHWSLVPPTYNLAASLNNTEEANSNSYPVYVLSSAIANRLALDYRQANQLTKDLDFRPSKMILKGMHRMALSFLAPKFVEIRKEEHPYAYEFGAVEILTALSIKEFMVRQNILDEDFEYILPAKDTFQK